MEMANQMLQEMRAANKRKTPQASTNKANANWDRPTSTGSAGSATDVTNLMSKMYMDDEQPSPGPTPSSVYRADTSPQMRPMPPLPTTQDPYVRPPATFDLRMNMPQPQPPPHGTSNRYAPVPNSAMVGRPPPPTLQISSPKMPQQIYPQPYPSQPGYLPQRPQPPQHDMSSRVSVLDFFLLIMLVGTYN